MMSTMIKKNLLSLSGFVAQILPLLVLVGIRWEDYAPKESTGLRWTFAFGIALFCAFLIFAKYYKLNSLLITFGILALASWVVSYAGMQMYEIFTAAFFGVAADEGIFKKLIDKEKTTLNKELELKAEENYKKKQLKKQEKAERKKITL